MNHIEALARARNALKAIESLPCVAQDRDSMISRWVREALTATAVIEPASIESDEFIALLKKHYDFNNFNPKATEVEIIAFIDEILAGQVAQALAANPDAPEAPELANLRNFASSPDARVPDLSRLVARLMRELKKADPTHQLPMKAMEYLSRHNLIGSPLRSDNQVNDAVEMVDAMDWPLPCDVTVGAGTNKKGTPLSALILRMKVLHGMAMKNAPAADNGAWLSATQAVMPDGFVRQMPATAPKQPE